MQLRFRGHGRGSDWGRISALRLGLSILHPVPHFESKARIARHSAPPSLRSGTNRSIHDLDYVHDVSRRDARYGPRSRAGLEGRGATRCALRRTVRLCGAIDAYLLPAVLPVTPTVARPREFLPRPIRGGAGRILRGPPLSPS